jgi:hypothetical protein
MTRRKRKMTPQRNAKWLAEGRGQGRKEKYESWLRTQDLSSKGNSHRPTGQIVKRLYNLFSDKEMNYFACLEQIQSLLDVELFEDVREQFPLLPQEETIEIAELLKIPHPSVDGELIVMTTDFVITLRKGFDSIDIARTLKLSEDLLNPRTIEKLEIERIYWARRGIDWGIVTPKDIPDAFLKNALEFRKHFSLDNHPIDFEDIVIITEFLTEQICQTVLPLNKFCLEADTALGYDRGTCLTVAKHLIACGYWQVDFFTPIKTTDRLRVIKTNEGKRPR